MNDVESVIRELLVQTLDLDTAPELIPPRGILNILGIDSLSAMRFLISVEGSFGIRIEDSELGLDLVDDLPALAARVAELSGERQ
ncbi:acyl carrier protein [Catenulispora sp. GP43]|uniref:acyl carrier protein n=1 Tax=Catenulispora sp. GP43 TaxID=3156263 RepID=UPI0035148808